MKKTAYIKLVCVVVFYAVAATAQQNNLLNTYSYDLMQLNIASIGSKCTDVNLNYRTQWASVKENPKTFQLNASMAFGANTGVGIKVRQQTLGLLTFNNITGGYAYRVRLNNKTKLHLGVGLAWQQNVFNANKAIVVDAVDNTVNNGTLRANNFDAEAGAMVLGEKITLGLSANNIYNTNSKFVDNAFITKPQVNAVLAYKFNKGKGIEVEPWLVNRYTIGGKNQTEGLVNCKFLQCLTIGVGYRSSYGIIGLAGFEKNMFKIIYSYDYNISQQLVSYGSSHQIMLGINLCPKPKAKPEPVVVTPPVKEEPIVITEEPKKVEELKKEVEPKKEEPKIDEVAERLKKQQEALHTINNLCNELEFDVNKTTLAPTKKETLDKIAALINENDLTVSIIGYASKDGNPIQNKTLSIMRANYVQNQLIKRGVKASALKHQGIGDTQELFDNNNKALKSKNRTVRIEKID